MSLIALSLLRDSQRDFLLWSDFFFISLLYHNAGKLPLKCFVFQLLLFRYLSKHYIRLRLSHKTKHYNRLMKSANDLPSANSGLPWNLGHLAFVLSWVPYFQDLSVKPSHQSFLLKMLLSLVYESAKVVVF